MNEDMDSKLGWSDPVVVISRAATQSICLNGRAAPTPGKGEGSSGTIRKHGVPPTPVNPCTFIVVPAAVPRSVHLLCCTGAAQRSPAPLGHSAQAPLRPRGPVPTCFPSPLRANQSESLSLWDSRVTRHRAWHMGAIGSVC